MLPRLNRVHAVFFYVASLTIVAFDISALSFLAGVPLAHAEEQLMLPEFFLEQAFTGKTAQSKLLLLTPPLRAEAQQVLGHAYQGMRVRYWWLDGRSAWILDEVGKEKPITLGVVVEGMTVDQEKIKSVELLVYREERGGEIRLASFRNQFIDALLKPDHQLDRQIDGISGATLSVNATRNAARLALLFHRYVAAKAP